MSTAVADEEIVYAGFWERFAAWIVDVLVLVIVWTASGFAAGTGIRAARSAGMGTAGTRDLVIVGLAVLGFYGLLLLLFSAYFVLMESGERGATLGKRALGLRVVDGRGERLSLGRALGRFFAHLLSGITLGVGYLIQPFTARRQALHDFAAGTRVIRTRARGSRLVPVISTVGLLAVVGIVTAVELPVYNRYDAIVKRSQLRKAAALGRMAAHAVEEYSAKTGKFPATLADTGARLRTVSVVSDVKVNQASGEVQVVLNSAMGDAIAGKALVFDPWRDAKGQIIWKCSAPGISQKSLLPADCR